MSKLYLKIVDIDRFEDTKLVNEKKATHVVEIDDDDYSNVVELFNKYLPKIQLHFPMDPAVMKVLEQQ